VVGHLKDARLFAVATLVALMAVVPVNAMAAKKGIVLKEEGKPVANGAPAFVRVFLATCEMYGEGGNLSGIGSSKVKLKASKTTATECNEAIKVDASFTEAQLSTSGQISVKGKVTVQDSETGCVYEFKTFKATEAVSGIAGARGSTSGKRTKASPKTCVKTSPEKFTVALIPPSTEAGAFEAEL
jgi:hypothetical protein